MKFFFPDSQDQIDPCFDFLAEERGIFRVRQRDDHYAHEALREPPFNGLLVSKAIVDGTARGVGKYTVSQRHRLYRQGAERFFRLNHARRSLEIMGDCGAFNYAREDVPPYTPDDVIDFYQECGFDLGVSVDHVIFGYNPATDHGTPDPALRDWSRRQDLTLELAAEFLTACRRRKTTFEPLGVAQGWSPVSYAHSVATLQKIGYQRIALGGMVPLKTHDIMACLTAIDDVRENTTQLHLLGISRCGNATGFASLGVTSFDTTSPFQQAFKDDKDNYYTLDRTYVAIRVPQVDGNNKLKNAIRAGRISQDTAIALERECLRALRAYAVHEARLADVLNALRAYESLYDPRKDHSDVYRQTLADRPWEQCACGICERIGVEVILFRGSERNKSRGFHNLHVFSHQLDRELAGSSA
ncbi:MAG: tRNA-guanine transglycosylase DpdA [Pseudonocardiaceae bacterium]